MAASPALSALDSSPEAGECGDGHGGENVGNEVVIVGGDPSAVCETAGGSLDPMAQSLE